MLPICCKAFQNYCIEAKVLDVDVLTPELILLGYWSIIRIGMTWNNLSHSQYIYINIYILGYFRQNKSNVQCNGYNWIKHSTYQLSVTPYLCISGAIWCPYQPNLHGSWPRSWATVIMILDASDPHLLHPMDNLSIHTFLPL